ncbi:MAG: glycogen debranching protein GlgX [Treponema sp.]|nr:glycogen debranching protein GlgX [Treponema sp.]
MDSIQISAGKPMTPGAHVVDGGVNFTVFSRNATSIFLELFDSDEKPLRTIQLTPEENRTGDIWHVFVKGLQPGALYLYRADGPDGISRASKWGKDAPQRYRADTPTDAFTGNRFNKDIYLFDPCARAFTDGSVFKNLTTARTCPLEKMPKCVVVDSSAYDWEGDRPLKTPLEKTIIYEMHVKGFTASGSSGAQYPGTYRACIEKIPYLQELGITAVELLPVQEFDENEGMNINPRTGKRLTNYWGYSTIGFYAPKVGYAADKTPGAVVSEFKDLVKALHKAGIEVILDIVFNHTAEGNEKGVTLNFRGLDNSIYYTLVPEHKEYYTNYSGCGNTVNCNHPAVQGFIINCLRYWVLDMHVDGFRFDLAGVFCRDEKGWLMQFPPLVHRISEDPVLRDTKIIAEPWDCGGAYYVGNFPGSRWCEWNDKYRDALRRFIRGDENTVTEAATRMTGSSDLYSASGRGPIHSINFIDCHDGFPLNDLVTYNSKHNEQNGEENRDGNDNNISYNYGFEGPVDNPRIERLREQQIKNFFTALFISRGTPMFLAGDEVRHTQGGNNNAYCQDNEISWFNWADLRAHASMLTFVKRLISLRKNHPTLCRHSFLRGAGSSGPKCVADITWHDWDGKTLDWSDTKRFLGFRLGGAFGLGYWPEDADFYIAFNTDIHDITITVPIPSVNREWYRVVDTSVAGDDAALDAGQEEKLVVQDRYVLPANSTLVLISKPVISAK